jgi:hypothetical protein
MTLFHITAGDPWPEEPSLYDEDGTVNWRVGLFHLAYEISVGWVILQVQYWFTTHKYQKYGHALIAMLCVCCR